MMGPVGLNSNQASFFVASLILNDHIYSEYKLILILILSLHTCIHITYTGIRYNRSTVNIYKNKPVKYGERAVRPL